MSLDAATVLAHGVGGRTDLPLDTRLAVTGAALAVLASLVAVAVLWPRPRLRGAEAGRPLPAGLQRFADSEQVRDFLRLIVLAVTVFVVVVALIGPAFEALNLAPYAVYVTFWAGLVPASLLLGPIWRIVNPLRFIHRGVERLSGLSAGAGTRPLPAKLGWWPAAVWLAVFVWLELVNPDRGDPRVVGTFLVIYAAVNLVAAQIYGSAWFARGDGFEAYSTLIGRLSPLGRRADGRLVVRNPLDGLSTLGAQPGLAAVAIVLMGSTAFDGLTRTRFWVEEIDASSIPLGTLGLVGITLAIALLYLAATGIAERLTDKQAPQRTPERVPATVGAPRDQALAAQADDSPEPLDAAPHPSLGGVFAASLVPIAVGYAIAHYFSLFLFEGQTTWILASDPFRTGADYLGLATRQIDFTAVSTSLIGFVQIGAIVIGHIVGVVLAHDRAVSLFPHRTAQRVEIPLGIVMIFFTGIATALLLST